MPTNLDLLAERRKKAQQSIQPTSIPAPTPTPTNQQKVVGSVETPKGILSYGDTVNGQRFESFAPNALVQPEPTPSPARKTPIVPTPQNPVTTFGQAEQESTQPTLEDIALKRYKGETLSDEEFKFLFNEQKKQNEATLQNTGYQDVIDFNKKTLQDAETRALEQKKLFEDERQKAFELGQEQLNQKYGTEIARVKEAGERTAQASQQAMSFSGFGRSTVNADKQAQIFEEAGRAVQNLESAKQLELQLLEATLRGDEAEKLAGLQSNIDNLRKESEDYEAAALTKIAELNQKNNVSFADAFKNLTEVLGSFSSSAANKVSKETSELLGYVADEYGNPIKSPDGSDLKLPNNGVKYDKYTDDYTGQTYFYNPYDPTDVKFAPGNTIQSFVNQLGVPSTTSTSTIESLQPLKPASELEKYADNCVLYVKNGYCPNLPSGAVSVQGRRNGIEEAKKNGYGGTDMSQARVGDAIHTNEGAVGHTARIVKIENGKAILEEANYDKGKITIGREIDLNDPAILGWIRPSNQIPATPTQISEGNNFGILEQYQPIQFSSDAIRDFQTYATKGQLPSFSGSSQFQKDQKEANFRKNYNLWAAQNPQTAPQYDLDQVNKLASRYKPLSDEVRKLEQGFAVTKDFNKKTTNPYDDQALIFSFMRVLDPASVVREGEFNFAARNTSYLESLFTGATQAIYGTGLLGEEQRTNIINTMNTLYNKKKQAYDTELNGAKQVGQAFGIPSNLFLNFDTSYFPPDFNSPAFQQGGVDSTSQAQKSDYDYISTLNKVTEILRNAPAGTTPQGIIAALREQGHTLEGYEEAQSETFGPVQGPVRPGATDPLSQQIRQAQGSSALQGPVPLNPISSQDVQLQASQKRTYEQGKALEEKTKNLPSDPVSRTLGSLAQTAFDYGVKPPVKALLQASVGPLVASAKRDIAKFKGKSREEANLAEAEPIDVPLIGNINPLTKRNTSNFYETRLGKILKGDVKDLGIGSALSENKKNIGTVLDFVGSLLPVKKAFSAGKAAITQGIGKEIQEEDATFGDVIKRGAIEGGTSFGFTALVNKFLGPSLRSLVNSKEAKEAIKNSKIVQSSKEALKKEAVEDVVGKYFENLSKPNKEFAKEIFDAAEEKAAGNFDAPNVFEVAGKPIENFIQEANDILSKLGNRLGKAKEGLRDIDVNLQPVKEGFEEALSSLNIKKKMTDKGLKLVFDDSSIVGNSAAKQQFNRIFKKLQDETANAFDVEIITDQIDELTGLLGSTGFKKSKANTALGKIKKTINDTLSESSGEFSNANARYAQLVNALDSLTAATKVKVGKKYVQSGAQLLRRLKGNSPYKNQEALKAIDYIKKEFGLKGLDDLATKAQIADFAEKITGTVNPQSLAGVTNSGVIGKLLRSVPGVKNVTGFVDFLSEASEVMKSKKAPLRKAEAVKGLLNDVPSDVLDKATSKNKVIEEIFKAFNVNLRERLSDSNDEK